MTISSISGEFGFGSAVKICLTLHRVFGSDRLNDAMPMLYASPGVKLFRWSPLVTSAFVNNAGVIAPNAYINPPMDDPYAPIPGLLALHIRRGDFEGHCDGLARWRSSWSAYNHIPEMVDKYHKPPVGEDDIMFEEGQQYYKKTCYPSIKQIIEKVAEIKQTPDGNRLKNIFIMTNGREPWITELKNAFNVMGGWGKIASSRDMILDWEQTHVAGSIDMMIGHRADVFVGNGVSGVFVFSFLGDAD